MTLAIVHYHLGPGGVSNVIITASRALTAAGIRHVILVSCASGDALEDLPIQLVPDLAYRTAIGNQSAHDLTTQLREAAAHELGKPPDIWHFHNHSLGKNPLVPLAVARLAQARERLILQIHDLAEDGRLANLRPLATCPTLYPMAERVHYAFLNSRDRQRFIQAGLPQKQAHLLVNPIETPTAPTPRRTPDSAPLMLYPVRGIRRKNLGEFILLAALAPPGTRSAMTRAPQNPLWLRIHEQWKALATHHKLPVEFDVVGRIAPCEGAGNTFSDWQKHATHQVTSSVAEGFGMVFIESIASGIPLLGRELPHLATDHKRHGIQTGQFYQQILIPVDWIGLETLKQHLLASLTDTWRAAGLPLPPNAIESAYKSLLHDGWIDFGNLPESLQQIALLQTLRPENRQVPQIQYQGKHRPLADWLADVLSQVAPTVAPASLSAWSPENHLATLSTIARHLMDAPSAPPEALNRETILHSYLSPQHFHFLTSPRVGHLPPPPLTDFNAIIFDVYGTLLIAPPGGVKPNPHIDPVLRSVLNDMGFEAPQSPSSALHTAVVRHHTASTEAFPEIDLHQLWREILQVPEHTDITELVTRTEAAWHPARWMPGAETLILTLVEHRIPIGLLSNAQCNTLPTLGMAASLIDPDLCILSYQHGIAKPSNRLFQILAQRLACRGIRPADTLFIGNDPTQDITPAAAAGFQTALFSGHPDSGRPGPCFPDYEIHDWNDARMIIPSEMRHQ